MPDEKTLFHNPFAALGRLRGTPPADPPSLIDPPASAKKTAQTPRDTHPTSITSVPRAVVRLERSGRGGKAVTVIDHLDVADRDDWLKALKSSLGCGGTVEGDRLVLQGDQRERLKGVLTARGVKKITVA